MFCGENGVFQVRCEAKRLPSAPSMMSMVVFSLRKNKNLQREFMRVVFLLAFFSLFLLASANVYAAPPYSHIVVDGHTGKTLLSHRADKRRYPASLTKVMTLYILFEEMKAGRLKPWSRLRASRKASLEPASKIGIRKGETIMVRDAIKALVVKSANDVAVVVAENIEGSEWNFAKRMTATAKRLGMRGTNFRNASGLPDKRQYTTARDMAKLGLKTRAHFPQYAAYFKTKKFTWKGRTYRSYNRLLTKYRGSDGMKTGYIRASGYNLTTSAHRGKKYLMAVVIGAKSAGKRNRRMASLLDKSWKKARNLKPKKRIAIPTRPTPVKTKTAAAAKPKGSWVIQVGAFLDKSKAMNRLHELQKASTKVLNGKKPVAQYHGENGMKFYRARFAGFNQNSAKQACTYLIRKSVNCYPLAR